MQPKPEIIQNWNALNCEQSREPDPGPSLGGWPGGGGGGGDGGEGGGGGGGGYIRV